MTPYQTGRAFENRVVEHFRGLGYFALRSPGSKSKIDVIAIKPFRVLFIQCKRTGKLDPAEWNELFTIASTCGAIPLLASYVARKPIVFEQLMGLKDGSGRSQPKRLWPAPSS